jgi:hypothetical protein
MKLEKMILVLVVVVANLLENDYLEEQEGDAEITLW